jgi:2',3'-cyclic-nucleotide 2'-phosphodiesterase (5'-nucleotidase family)
MKQFLYLSLILCFFSCATRYKATGPNDDGRIDVNFIQINDVYEIAGVSGGREGGLARIATLKKKYQQTNPNTFTVIAGDFLSPSVYNSLQYEGKPVRGKQMVETLNASGLDFAVFGNHEFDIKENELQERINESKFQWISTNTFHKAGDQIISFSRSNGLEIPKTHILDLQDADGTRTKIGLIGLCLPFNKADYVYYSDLLPTAKEAVNKLMDSVDAVIAITHQFIEDDEILAREIPKLAVIIGGHEHDQRFKKIGKVYITKAMANARSAYVIKLSINRKRNKIKTTPELIVVNEQIEADSATNSVVQKWTRIAADNFSTLGFDAGKTVLNNGAALDGRESEVRSHPTNLTQLLTTAMKYAAPKADAVLLNAGSIRVDDILPIPITQYDIIRALPFGGGIREVDMKGSLLIRILDQGEKNIGIGGYLLHNDEVKKINDSWTLNTQPIDLSKIYRVAITEFLLTGKESNLEFLNSSNPEIVKTYQAETAISSPLSDIRLALIKYLEKR